MRRRLWFRIVIGLLALVLLVGGSIYYRWSRGGLPQRSGTIEMASLKAAVEIRFDAWGVPHVQAESFEDLAQAAGWLHANDRMFQLELLRRSGSGRLSEVVGRLALGSDELARIYRLRRSAERMWEVLRPESRAALEAYARGVNAWLQQRDGDWPPDLRLLRVTPEPWTPIDSLLTHFLMARDLTYPARYEHERIQWLLDWGVERALEILGDPEAQVSAELAALMDGERAKIPESPAADDSQNTDPPAVETIPQEERSKGSNGWAVGSTRSTTGHPLVANDPHLFLAHPGFWYQATLRAPNYEATGMMLPGLPMIVIGQNKHLAWAFTNSEVDVTDLFLEELNEAGDAVRRGEEWLPIQVAQETIRVKDGEDVILEVRRTDIGPLLDLRMLHYSTTYTTDGLPDHSAFLRPPGEQPQLPPQSLAWTVYEPFDPVDVFLRMARAKNMEQIEAAAADFVCPIQNLVVGTKSGELLSTFLGRLPERGHGDGHFPGFAAHVDHHWQGLQPYTANPRVYQPPDDLLASANADVRPPGYTGQLTGDFASPHRTERIRQRLLERARWSVADMGALQTDVVSLYAREVCAFLAAPPAGLSPEAENARRILVEWDGSMEKRGPAALFAHFDDRLSFVASANYPHRIPGILRFLSGASSNASSAGEPAGVDRRSQRLEKALSRAWREVTTRFGENPADWNYGEIHTWTPYHPLNDVPVIGSFFRRGPFEVPGSATTIGVFSGYWNGFSGKFSVSHGASMRWVADTQDPDNSRAVLPVGQSGHPFDPHYDDQLETYLAGELRPVYWSDEAMEAATVSRLQLHP